LSAAGPKRGFAIFRHRDFTLFVVARFSAVVAVQMIVIAVGWQVYHLTGRVLDLGLIGLSQFLPFVCLALVAGHTADRYDRRNVMRVCLTLYLACALLLLTFARLGTVSVLPIFGVLGLLGVTRAFFTPATQSYLPNLVPVAVFSSAVAFSSSAFQVAMIAGPSIGGLVYAAGQSASGAGPRGAGGAEWVYGVAALLVLLGLVMMTLIGHRRAPEGRAVVTWHTLLEGLRFIWRRKTVLGAISLDLFAVLFGGATALLPAYTRDVLHAGPEVFGALRAAPGVGAVAMAVFLAFHPIRRHVGPTMFGGVAVFGAAVVVFGLTTHFWVAICALVILGGGDMISVFVRTLLVQLETPDEIRGRVSAVNSVCIGASNELGEFESGVTAAWLGLVPSIVLGGALTLLVAVVWARGFFPALWRLQEFESLKDPRG